MKTASPAALDELSRREFIVTTGAAAGTLVLGWAAPLDAGAQAASEGSELNVWVVVRPDERCVIRIA
ncbi:MAG TPA: twin-arginine translocation signal domain-containing protein, partial [Burkholderiaceae bacterium]|nr:twin-arginine translocation signal domain-containing protein [Burkholderiaceae bacterium]